MRSSLELMFGVSSPRVSFACLRGRSGAKSRIVSGICFAFSPSRRESRTYLHFTVSFGKPSALDFLCGGNIYYHSFDLRPRKAMKKTIVYITNPITQAGIPETLELAPQEMTETPQLPRNNSL